MLRRKQNQVFLVLFKLVVDSCCCEKKAQVWMNYSVSGCLISSGTNTRSPWMLKQHLTVNTHRDKQEFLHRDLCPDSHSRHRPTPSLRPVATSSWPQPKSIQRCCQMLHNTTVGRPGCWTTIGKLCSCIYKYTGGSPVVLHVAVSTEATFRLWLLFLKPCTFIYFHSDLQRSVL